MKKKLLITLTAFLLITISVLSMIYYKYLSDSESIESYPKPSVITSEDPSSKALKMLNVPNISQYPKLPTGCEATAAAMVLQYYGADIGAEEFAAEFLANNDNFYHKNGKLYGPNPNEVFAGNPFSDNSYGCFAPPIVDAANRIGRNFFAKSINDKTLSELCRSYIDNDKPLLIWATMGMKKPKIGDSWLLEDGTEFTWISGEHCLVLVGYSDEFYFFNDPQIGDTVGFSKTISEQRFSSLGSQAVLISKYN